MSIIDDVRIKQGFDKDGKYVCDLNHKEETKFDINLRKAMTSNTVGVGKFTWCYNGIEIKEGSLSLTDPVDFMDAAVSWFEYAKKYKWRFPSDTVNRQRYLTLVISALEDLI